jgi:RNA polymerase sigma factor (sigma-70 family)
MTTGSDQELLEQYYRHGSEAAFAELVRRHVDTVFSAAIRLLVDRHLAEDVVQQVFVALARTARTLAHRAVISGWLHRTTHNFAVMIIRREERRRAREQKAITMSDPEPWRHPSEDNPWNLIRPHLDNAIAQLSEADRDTIALRFFDRKTAADIGGILGISEEAAQKRVRRAVERLRQVLARSGVTVPVAGLAAAISENVLQAAPGPLAETLAAKALIAVATAGVSSGLWCEAVQWTTAHPVAAALAGMLVVSLGTGGYLTGRASAREHWQAVRWHNALVASPSLAELPHERATPLSAPDPAAAPSTQPGRPSVTEVLAAAAEQFRNREDDPDAWAKGFVLMEQLRAEDVPGALRVLEGYRQDPAVYGSMASLIMRVWARSEPKAALDYALRHLGKDVGLSIEFVTSSWAEQDPHQAWKWYRETSDSGDPPMADASWMWVPKHIYGSWAATDPAAAVSSLEEIPYGDRDHAIFGIAEAAREPAVRPRILEAIDHMTDENQKRELARRLAAKWAETEPATAAEWAAALRFENPAAKLSVMGEVAEEWWPIDRHATVQWLLANAPREVLSQVQAGIAEMTRRSSTR